MKLNNKGFTLVEVLAVVAVIAILGGIAIPNILSSINTGRDVTYRMMISNIMTASQSLYEEVEFNSTNSLYNYNKDGIAGEIKISGNSITTNLQTLVSNGFLDGANNNCNSGTDKDCSNKNNKNKEILIDPKSQKDIGECGIVIKKDTSSGSVSYKVNSMGGSNCPDKYEKEVKK